MTRTRRYRIRYRRVLAFVLVALVLAACTPPGLPDPLPPLASESTPQAPVTTDLISIGIDSAISGFNPYVTAQYSPAARSVAALVLPSVFTPGSYGPDATPTALVDSVEITSEAPFTVTYTLNRGAAWSDGTPIAAEDFSYLWQQMINPDQSAATVSPGGYQLISSISSEDGGKTVVVVFAVPYAGWRTLFSPLLPARSLKDTPGGFLGALSDGLPVAGGQYKMESYDGTIGEIKLARNDKFWAVQPGPPTVVFRVGSSGDMVSAFQRGDVNALYLSPDAETAAALTTLAAQNLTIRLTSVPQPATQQLQFNTAPGRPAQDVLVRRAIAAAVNTPAIGNAVAQGWSAGWIAPQAQLSLPSDPKAAVTQNIPNRALNSAETTQVALLAAGYQRSGVYYAKNGQVLRLNLGYQVGSPAAVAAAGLIQFQLGQVGILVNLVSLSELELQPPLLSTTVPDMVLGAVPRTASDGAVAVAALGCGPVLNPSAVAATSPEQLPASATTTSSTVGEAGGVTGEAGATGTEPDNCQQPTPFQLTEFLLGDDASALVPSDPAGAAPTTGAPTTTGPTAVGTTAAGSTAVVPTTGATTGASWTGVSSTAASTAGVGTVSTYQNPSSAPIQMAAAGSILDAELWARMASVPLAQPVMLLALGPSLAQVGIEPDPGRLLWEGPFQGLPDWPSPN